MQQNLELVAAHVDTLHKLALGQLFSWNLLDSFGTEINPALKFLKKTQIFQNNPFEKKNASLTRYASPLRPCRALKKEFFLKKKKKKRKKEKRKIRKANVPKTR